MSPAPAENITVGAAPVPRTSRTSTGQTFIAGISATGLAGVQLVPADALLSLNQWIAKYGGGSVAAARLAYSVDFDWIDDFFAKGGGPLWYSRVLGPNPVKATINLAGTGTTLTVTADEYGAFYNAFKIQVTNGTDGTTRIVKLLNAANVVIDQTAQFSDRTLVNGVKLDTGVGKVTIGLGGGSGLPTVAAATALAGGDDDHGNITQTQIDAAMALHDIGIGPGQCSTPNWQTDAARDSLDLHGAQHNRFAVPDPIDTTSKSTLVAAGQHRQAGANGSYGALYAPWLNISALSPSGTARAVPPSASVCARFATTDATDGPSQSPAGRWGILPATDVRATFSRLPQGASDADEISEAGVNLIIVRNGVTQIFDNLTGVADQENDEFAQIGVARWRMATIALIGAEADDEIFARVNLATLTAWKSRADAILLRQYNDGDLFGDLDDDRPETAFRTDVDTPNTPTTINAGAMNMNIAARPVKGGRLLTVSITAVPVNQSIAA